MSAEGSKVTLSPLLEQEQMLRDGPREEQEQETDTVNKSEYFLCHLILHYREGHLVLLTSLRLLYKLRVLSLGIDVSCYTIETKTS